MKNESGNKPKVPRETVVHEHTDGTPHLTVDPATKEVHHYMRAGCTIPVKVVLSVVAPPPR